ncbi:hypothetical protein Gotur_005904, partial [Gossypium turneri]
MEWMTTFATLLNPGTLERKLRPYLRANKIIRQEGQPEEMSLIINLLAERVENLKVPSQEMVKDFMDDTCIIHSYKVFKRNGDVLNEIFENYPNVADNFRITHPDSQSYFMNSLAELYQKIKSEEEMLQQNDITIM